MTLLTPEDHAFFQENGYLRVRNVVPKEDCDAVIDSIWDFLGMDRNDPNDWYRQPLNPGGMVEMYQNQAMWNNRQNPRMYQAFAELIGNERLWVTIDRVNLKPPRRADHPEYDHKGFIHWDVDLTKLPLPFWVQGVLYLTDTTADMGGFRCAPGHHKHLDEWIKSQPPGRRLNPPEDLSGIEIVPIEGNAGDLVIWDRTLLHGNGQNVSTRPRFAQYIAMFPVRDNEEERQHRIRCWQEHAPPGNKVFPGDPRHIEEQHGHTAELTPLGRRLLGVDSWP